MDIYLADIGNSALKLYSLKKDCFVYSYTDDEAELARFLHKARPAGFLVSSVSRRGFGVLTRQLEKLPYTKSQVQCLDYRAPFAFTLDIEQQETAGTDRLVDVEAALAKGLTPPLVVIDAGSAVTVNVVLNDNGRPVFKGGLIIPGEKLQRQALEAFTHIPPELIFRETVAAGRPEGGGPLWGRKTSEAIHYGIRNCILHGMNGILANLKKHCTITTLIFTGGNGKTLFDGLIGLGYNSQEMLYEKELAYYGLLSLAKKLRLI